MTADGWDRHGYGILRLTDIFIHVVDIQTVFFYRDDREGSTIRMCQQDRCILRIDRRFIDDLKGSIQRQLSVQRHIAVKVDPHAGKRFFEFGGVSSGGQKQTDPFFF